MFVDRQEAGRKLARRLESYRGSNAIVLALPRGGVVLGFEVSKALGLPLDIVAVRKIGHPSSSEYAIGAVDERGGRILNEREVETIDPLWLREETEREKKEALRRSAAYREGRVPQDLAGKIVIIVDDGIATGLTMQLAVRSVRAQNSAKVIVAVPVAPADSVQLLEREGADDVIVLERPEEFAGAVGAHYVRFEQVEDAEVVRLLRAAHGRMNQK